MVDLKKKIRRLQHEIREDKNSLAHSLGHLKQEVKSPAFIGTLLVGGLALGYLLASKRTGSLAKINMSKAPEFFKAASKHINVLWPIVTRFLL